VTAPISEHPGALIGYSGFVGSHLLKSSPNYERFNSKNIQDIRGRRFGRVVCAGVTAVKWWANQHPAEDWAGIKKLIDCLRLVSADSFTLISTVDVYGTPHGVTEDTRPVPASREVYGRNRLILEDFVMREFGHHHVVRLPALFGRGLKKNIVFDLMHDSALATINPGSRFQWYPVARLGDDLSVIERSGRQIINLATEPVATREIHDRYFQTKAIGTSPNPPANYDMRTQYASLLEGRGTYFINREDVLHALGDYLSSGN